MGQSGVHRLHPPLLRIGVLGAHFGRQPTPNRPQVGQDAGRLPLERRLLSFPAMELRPLPLPLFNLFAERGQSFFFLHGFPSDYSLEACWPGLYSRLTGSCRDSVVWLSQRPPLAYRRSVVRLYASRRAMNQQAAAASTVPHQNHSPKRVNQVIREE